MKTMAERRAYRRGLLAALELVEEWDQYVLHPWRLSDALRCKLNLLPKSRIRRNPMWGKEAVRRC